MEGYAEGQAGDTPSSQGVRRRRGDARMGSAHSGTRIPPISSPVSSSSHLSLDAATRASRVQPGNAFSRMKYEAAEASKLPRNNGKSFC